MENFPQDPIRVRTKNFYFQRIDSSPALDDSFALRYQVYCRERDFLSPDKYPDGLEKDSFDDASMHFGAFNVQGDMVGTVRLVQSDAMNYPMMGHCQIENEALPAGFAHQPITEVSRLSVSKLYRRRTGDGLYGLAGIEDSGEDGNVTELSRRQRPEIVLGLYKIMYQESKRQGIKFWLAAMEQSLSRLLNRYSFTFSAIGPQVDYYGPVTPYYVEIAEIEESVFNNCPDIFWEFMDGLEPQYRPSIASNGG